MTAINRISARYYSRFFVVVLLCLIGSGTTPVSGLTAGSGTIIGRVLGPEGEPLTGAAVSVRNTSFTTVSDIDGFFRLYKVPIGARTIDVQFYGFTSALQTITVEAGASVLVIVSLNRMINLQEEITVTAEPLLEGQARAMNRRKNALNIMNIVSAELMDNLPDYNSAEAAQRLPGISIKRDQGEGRYVLIRGTEPRLNATQLNGVNLPSPEGDIRSVALDVIPTEMLEAIVIHKTLTPDMDAASIGGAIDLDTRNASDTPRMTFSAGLGQNSISGGGIQRGEFSYGRRFNNNRFGLIFGSSFFNTDKGSENFEARYADGDLDALEIRDYTINRKRIGFFTAFDARISEQTRASVQGLFSRFDDHEYRRSVLSDIGNLSMKRSLKDRFEQQSIFSLKGELKHYFDSGIQFDASLAFSTAREREPGRRDTSFVQEGVGFSPNVTPDSINPADIQSYPGNENINLYLFDNLTVEDKFTRERLAAARVDISIPVSTDSQLSALIKTGGKIRFKHKKRNTDLTVFNAVEDISMAAFLDPDFNAGAFLDNRYTFGPFFTTDAYSRLFSLAAFTQEKNFAGDTEDYTAFEDTAAAYAMGEIFIGKSICLIPGFRYEYTANDYTGTSVSFDETGEFERLNSNQSRDSYGVFLPGFHLRYRIEKNINFRVSFTRSLARPDYFDRVPYQLINRNDWQVRMGNENLKPTKAWNADVMLETYLPTIGVFSVGVFYKYLKDYIYSHYYDADILGAWYKFVQPRNGNNAELWGMELAFLSQFRFLPSPLDGLGLILNYSFADSEARYPNRLGPKGRLPGQSHDVGNLVLSYERGRLSARFGINYHGRYVDAVGRTPDLDIFYDDHLQLDCSAGFQISPAIILFLEINNLTNEPLRYFIGTDTRPIQEEYYKIWGMVGLRIVL
ncbi:MAG: TonB-dependent receptor [Acidobacteria bacterium]|nr:TonB-dependent receptor [Acidobacteriota bacterium]MBU2437857.1 TonB-dependent receptor [Acidobacteriota bacterium]